MTFDKAAYQLDYMRRRRAGEPTSKVARLENAHRAILAAVGNRDTPVAKQIRAIAEQALNPPKAPIKDTGDE